MDKKAMGRERAKPRVRCLAAAIERARLVSEGREAIEMVCEMQEKYGIEPLEMMEFMALVSEGGKALSHDQTRQWREMAIRKIPAEEIYRTIFRRETK